MTTITDLKGGLAGACGSDYLPATNRLLFVEFDTGNLSALDLSTGASYSVLGNGYDQPEDVKATADGQHAYVTERSGTLRYADLASADAKTATVVTSGLNAPQQLFLDETAHAAYVVEYAPSGRLVRIDLVNGAQTVLLTGLSNAVGLTLSADRQHAYISEQLTAPGNGRVSSYQLSNGTRQTLASGLTSPFMLSWADAGQTMLYVTERDPANRLTSIVVATATAHEIVTGLPFRPSSTAVASPGNVLVGCDAEIAAVALVSPVTQDGLLLPSIGFIPVQWIGTTGLANTSVDPSYFYQVADVPFGGFLPVMVNYARATSLGGQYYRVLVDGVPRTDQFHGATTTGTVTVPATVSAQTLGGQPGYYPVPSAAVLETWIPDPPPGCYLDSTTLVSARLYKIAVEVVELVNNNVHVIETSPEVVVYVDNNPCRASIAVAPEVSATCGFIAYTALTQDVQITLAPSQPEGFATYSFTLIKGENSLTVGSLVPQGGPVGAVVSPVTLTMADLLGQCTVAGFAATLYVAASANSGWWRQSQYDAEAQAAFAIAPA